MKLTASLHRRITYAIMDDVPVINYGEQQVKLLIEWALTQLPPPAKQVWDDESLRPLIRLQTFSKKCVALGKDEPVDVFVHGIPLPKEYHDRVPLSLQHQLAALQLANDKQQKDRQQLEQEINQILLNCSTTKMLKKQCPEFEKYIPQDSQPVEKSLDLPAAANLVANLIKAGWPKQNAT